MNLRRQSKNVTFVHCTIHTQIHTRAPVIIYTYTIYLYDLSETLNRIYYYIPISDYVTFSDYTKKCKNNRVPLYSNVGVMENKVTKNVTREYYQNILINKYNFIKSLYI